jgi:branched-chain amino acid transport system ATP-binding protein
LRDVAAGGAAVLLAEQNARTALAVCDRALLMRLGSIIGEGTRCEIEGDERLARVMMGG